MAACSVPSLCQSLLEIGENAVKELLEKESMKTPVSVRLARTSKSTGEIIVRCREVLQQNSNFTVQLGELIKTSKYRDTLMSVTADLRIGVAYIKVVRESVFAMTIHQVVSQTDQYGSSSAPSLLPPSQPPSLLPPSPPSLLAPSPSLAPSSSGDGGSIVLSLARGPPTALLSLRALLVSELLQSLSKGPQSDTLASKKVKLDRSSLVASVLGLWSDGGCGLLSDGCGHSVDDAHLKEQFMSALPWQPGSPNIIVNGGDFLTRNNLIGGGGYPKNIDMISVESGGQLTGVGRLALSLYHKLKETTENVVIVVSYCDTHTVLQAMVVVVMAMAGVVVPSGHHRVRLLEVGPVSCGGMSVDEYIAKRTKIMEKACELKYGSIVEGSQLCVIAQTLSEAAIKFEMLSSDPRSILKIDPPTSTDEDSRYDGGFVLYNYARLATLVTNYNTAVSKGTYPPLPSVNDIDFALLNQEEEWDLLYSYILQYPQVLRDTRSLAESHKVLVASGLKSLTHFLTKMCHAFSKYYSKTKILMTPEPSLLPTVHARMMLVLALKQVLHNALVILGIQPLAQL